MRSLVLASFFVVATLSVGAAETPSAPEKPSPVQAWQAAMSRKLTQSALRENRACRRHCPTGKSIVSFTVHRDGAITDVHVSTSSGSATIDASVILAVQKASPLPPIPPEIAEDTRTVNVPIRFSK